MHLAIITDVERNLALSLDVVQKVVEGRKQVHILVSMSNERNESMIWRLGIQSSREISVKLRGCEMIISAAIRVQHTSGSSAPSKTRPSPSRMRYVGIGPDATELKKSSLGVKGRAVCGSVPMSGCPCTRRIRPAALVTAGRVAEESSLLGRRHAMDRSDAMVIGYAS